MPFSSELGLNPALVNLAVSCCHPVAGTFLAEIEVHFSSPHKWPLFSGTIL